MPAAEPPAALNLKTSMVRTVAHTPTMEPDDSIALSEISSQAASAKEEEEAATHVSQETTHASRKRDSVLENLDAFLRVIDDA